MSPIYDYNRPRFTSYDSKKGEYTRRAWVAHRLTQRSTAFAGIALATVAGLTGVLVQNSNATGHHRDAYAAALAEHGPELCALADGGTAGDVIKLKGKVAALQNQTDYDRGFWREDSPDEDALRCRDGSVITLPTDFDENTVTVYKGWVASEPKS